MILERQTVRIKEIPLWITNLISFVVDAVCQWVGPHANIEVSVTEPLHCLLHVGDCPQSDLNPGEKREKHSSHRVTNITGLCHHLVDTSGNCSLNTNCPVSVSIYSFQHCDFSKGLTNLLMCFIMKSSSVYI